MIYYVLAASLFLLGYVLYSYLVSIEWDEAERRRLEVVELRLAHILRLIDAPDVRLLLEDARTRQSLFLDFSEFLLEDVKELIWKRSLSPAGLGWALLFLAVCYAMRVKARIACGRNDLRFLTGLELVVVRNGEKTT